MSRAPAVERALLLLGGIVALSTAVRVLLGSDLATPWIAPDEHLYGLLGRSLAAGDGLTVLGERTPYYSTLYPILVGLPLLVVDIAAGVTVVKVFQALLMSATAIPVYLWARPLAGPRWSLVAAALTVLLPGLVYSGLFMSEALYFPLATIAVWLLAICLRSPTRAHQGLLLAAVAVALTARLQAVAFIGVILAAVALLATMERSWAPFRRMALTLGVLAAVAVAGLVAWLAGSGGQLVGAYAPLTEAREYSVSDVAGSLARHVGAVTLITVAVPLLAFGVLAWEALRGRESDAAGRAFVAAALAYLAVTVTMVGAFASRFVEHVTERQLLSVVPPVFVAFAVWLARGAPRPQPVTSILAIGIAASVLLLPLEAVATLTAAADSPSTVPLEQLRAFLGTQAFELVYTVSAAALLAIAVLVPRRGMPALAGVIGVLLAVGSVAASREFADRSQIDRAEAFSGYERGWIDATGADDVTLLVTGDRTWPTAWQELFWDTSITRILRFRDIDSIGVAPQEPVAPASDGRLLTPDGTTVAADYVAAPATVSLDGERVAELPPGDEPGMTVWHANAPLRVGHRIFGLRPNGDVYGSEPVTVEVYGCRPGRLELTLLGKEGLPVRILRGGRVRAERTLASEEIWRPAIPAPASADGTGACIYRIESDGLVGSTRIEFVPE